MVQYEGTPYSGFQLQANDPTVQLELEKAIFTVLREEVRIHCCGRTDAGVHAAGQVVSFHSLREVDNPGRFIRSLNAILPDDISVSQFHRMPLEFHPRFSCVAREYEYLFWTLERTPFWRGRAWMIRGDLDVDALNQELKLISGEQDFQSMTRAENADTITQRYLESAVLERLSDPYTGQENLIRLTVLANAFLHNMIRILAGTIVDRARGKIGPIADVLKARSRVAAGQTAPAHGLYFKKAYYPPGLGLPSLDLPQEHPLTLIHARRIQRFHETGLLDEDGAPDE